MNSADNLGPTDRARQAAKAIPLLRREVSEIGKTVKSANTMERLAMIARLTEIDDEVAKIERSLESDPDDEEDEPEQRQSKVSPLPISDFIAHSPDHSYIYRPTGEEWTSTAVNARVVPVEIGGKKALPANVWLDRNNPVEQRAWAPGEPQIIEDKLVAEGGFFAKRGARVFNLYKSPRIIPSFSRDIRFWRDHLHALWPDEADHITRWFAHRVQRPGEPRTGPRWGSRYRQRRGDRAAEARGRLLEFRRDIAAGGARRLQRISTIGGPANL
jgi:hypothetical protein